MSTLAKLKPKEKIKSLTNLSYHYAQRDPLVGIKLGYEALSIAKSLKDSQSMATSLGIIGINYSANSQFIKALEFQQQALKMYKRNKDKQSAAAMDLNISSIYMNISNYSAALQHCLNALRYYDSTQNATNSALILSQIGTIYFRLENYDQTLKYYDKAFKKYTQVNDTNGLAKLNNSYGIYYNALGDYENAILSHRNGIEYAERSGNYNQLTLNLVNLANALQNKHQFDSAAFYYNKALTIYKEVGNQLGVATTLGNIGINKLKWAEETSIKERKDELLLESRRLLESSISSCKSLHAFDPAYEFMHSLSDNYKVQGDYKKAYDLFLQYHRYEDSIRSLEHYNKLAGLEFEYNVKVKESEIATIAAQLQIANLLSNKSKNKLIIYSCIVLILALILIILWRKFMSIKVKYGTATKILEEKILETEMQMENLTKHSQVLKDIGYMQAHQVRGPVTTLLSMAELYNRDNPLDPINQYLIDNMELVTLKLDNAVKAVIAKGDEVRERNNY